MRPPQPLRKVARKVVKPDSRLETTYRRLNQRRAERAQERMKTWEENGIRFRRSHRSLLIESLAQPEPSRGIYLFGGCDLPSLFRMAPALAQDLRGTVAIHKPDGGISTARSDRQLQLLEEGERPDAEEISARLKLPANYFEPVLFEPTFRPAPRRSRRFPKTVIALSAGSDIIRPLYKRRSTGTMVDPGGWWLNQSVDARLTDPDTLKWFKKEFVPVGRPSPDDFAESFGRYLEAIRREAQPEAILVFNLLTVEPADPTHNYQFRPKAESLRRRRFSLILRELSERHDDVLLLDVDCTLKGQGVGNQLDFAHFPEETFDPLGAEAHRMLTRAGVF